MVPFDRPYDFLLVSHCIALSCTIFELFGTE